MPPVVIIASAVQARINRLGGSSRPTTKITGTRAANWPTASTSLAEPSQPQVGSE